MHLILNSFCTYKKNKEIKDLGEIVITKSKKAYDCVVKVNNNEYLIKILIVKPNSKLQIYLKTLLANKFRLQKWFIS